MKITGNHPSPKTFVVKSKKWIEVKFRSNHKEYILDNLNMIMPKSEAYISDALVNREKFISLIVSKPDEYQKVSINLVRDMTSNKKMAGVYVTLGRPFKAIEENLKKEKINTKTMIFIDGITLSSSIEGQSKKEGHCVYIQSPQSLTDLSIAINEAINSLPSKDKFLLFDSLSTLLIYNKAESVIKFMHFLTSRIKLWGIKGIILSVDSSTSYETISQISMFVDQVLDLSKNKAVK